MKLINNKIHKQSEDKARYVISEVGLYAQWQHMKIFTNNTSKFI